MLWFDLDNSPHVPLFRPVFQLLEQRNTPFHVTSREFAQTNDLLRYWNIPHSVVGTHGGKSKVAKLWNLWHRSTDLKRHMNGINPALAVSHGSRTQLLAARRLGVPSILMLDYEYTESNIFNWLSTHLLMPDLIPEERLRQTGFNLRKIIRYPGFKEQVYLESFRPGEGIRESLGVDSSSILAVVRPPSLVGNYHDPRSEGLLLRALEVLAADARTVCLVIARGETDRALVRRVVSARGSIRLLDRAVDGLQLLWHSDLVIGGGGTMNREAALMGIPVYSIFTGKQPYLDEFLEREGRLRFLHTVKDVEQITIRKRDPEVSFKKAGLDLPSFLADLFMNTAYRKH